MEVVHVVAPTDMAKLDNAVALYLAGKSAYELQTTLGVDRSALKRELLRRGVEPRSRSAAGLNRTEKMSAAERLAQVSAAHRSNRGRVQTFDSRSRYAAAREKNPPAMSAPEAAFADWLGQRGIPYRREVAVGIYNLDFALGSVGVEILGGEWHAEKKARHGRRTPYILSEGWSLCFLWDTVNHPMTLAAAEQVITYAQHVSRNPATIGEYRVIRGDGNLIASGRCDDGEFAGVPPARDSVNS